MMGEADERSGGINGIWPRRGLAESGAPLCCGGGSLRVVSVVGEDAA